MWAKGKGIVGKRIAVFMRGWFVFSNKMRGREKCRRLLKNCVFVTLKVVCVCVSIWHDQIISMLFNKHSSYLYLPTCTDILIINKRITNIFTLEGKFDVRFHLYFLSACVQMVGLHQYIHYDRLHSLCFTYMSQDFSNHLSLHVIQYYNILYMLKVVFVPHRLLHFLLEFNKFCFPLST